MNRRQNRSESLVESFVAQVIHFGPYEELDRLYVNNRVLALVGDEALDVETLATDLLDLKEELVAVAVVNGQIGDSQSEKEILGASLMDLLTPSPSQLNRQFWEDYAVSPHQAIADFYALSQRNDYIKVRDIAKNIVYTSPTSYGDLEITINLSKPEKDPKEIAAAREQAVSHYPVCQLCFENEGYHGRLNHPARANHRMIRFDLDGKEWGFQYSPYAYFKEHCIFLDKEHRPMEISRSTFERLFGIVERFSDYFAGSNADLPIVGGSILTHEHYQGGRHTFPMEIAELESRFTFRGFETVEAGIVKWPMSVIRLRSQDKSAMLELADRILQKWKGYSDPEHHILAYTGRESHHTITPIARLKQGLYELDLVLRDNQTSEEFPDGIYHPHPDVQHIKKENIGLIEVMGLAILPPRLKDELAEVEKFLLGKEARVAPYHKDWANRLKQEFPDVYEDTVVDIVRQSVGQIFCRVLEDAGVYKRHQEGQKAFLEFIKTVGIKEKL
ncbi:UDP-glucose--hexose-1-phosphate uridylyltransferase [Streptococcus himalayensis]|uniref:Galactose-1-phosphate uridylyltransferase n=1 Tax=Streptococcus himalayensis TaxID=1888195 RepID=A0A917A454_9STRE|nr:UDP-glucose--hexose-1-phosphate uridylyltransferase [Streptococcus himalayensis]GGE25498.1 galactose-1-phosphate uridylyltransferase [Streptococcus himalayensis]